jgi:hypothetical protein
VIQCWINAQFPNVNISGGGSALAYVAQTNGYGVAFTASWVAEIPIEGVAASAPGTSWTIELTNTTPEDALCNIVAHWTPPSTLAYSEMPWRIAYAETPDSERNIYRNATGNDGLRIEFDGATATWIRDSLAGIVIPAMSSVVIRGVVVNCEPEDLNGSGDVDSQDLAILLGQFGQSGPADFDGSGTVGPEDLAQILGRLNGGDQ